MSEYGSDNAKTEEKPATDSSTEQPENGENVGETDGKPADEAK
jgi:hypothetical protein